MSHIAGSSQAPSRRAADRSAAPPDRQAPPGPVHAAVDVSDLVIRRAKTTVLDGISFGIPTGRITGLLGPSGSGKTTLMRAIVGVQNVTAGTVTVLGHPAGSPELRREVGYVTQAPSVY
ncbi:MAG TPA: ATP-binding cassette domain-containing protein, partial [Micrococcaceae bacterium]